MSRAGGSADLSDLVEQLRASLVSWVGAPGAPVAPPDLGIDPVDALVALLLRVDQFGRSADGAGPDVPAGALKAAVRALLDRLVARAPGRSVEVRIPPFAAVQCGEGPRHTRGTPPNTVETDAWTWLRLATGARTWGEAVADGSVRASGQRADLSAYLPLVE